MKVVFRRSDGLAEKIIDVSPSSKLGESRKAAQMLLGLPEDPTYRLVLGRTDQELEDRLNFKEAGVRANDELILASTKHNTASKKVNLKAVSPEKISAPVAKNHISVSRSRNQESLFKLSGWQKASLAGGIFGTLVVFGMFLTNNSEPVSSNVNTALDTPENGSQSSSVDQPNDLPDIQVAPETIAQDEALKLVNSWLNAKTKMNAPPYDRQILNQVATGEQYSKAAGTIDWLIENNAYYSYNSQRIESVGEFYSTEDKAAIQVTVVEDLILYINGRVNSNRSGLKRTEVIYNLQLIDGSWKIASSAVVN